MQPATVFCRSSVQMTAQEIVAAWLLAFTLSLADLVIASFVTGPGAATLPMRVYSQVRLGVTPEINAISTLFIAAVAATVALASLVNKGLFAGRSPGEAP